MSKQTWMVFLGILGWIGFTEQTHAEIKHREHYSRAHAAQRESSESEDDYDPGHGEYPWMFLAPMEGRKVALNGMPMAGPPPETSVDSDYYREDTSLDACDMDVQHSVTDIHVPVGSGHLALEVRRMLTQEIWGDKSLDPDDRPDKPFGKGWISNVTPSIYWSRGYFGDGHLYVTDHTGQQYTFYTPNASSTPYPVAQTGQSAMDMLRTRLVRNGDATYTLTLPSGTVLRYSGLIYHRTTQRVITSGLTLYRYHDFARLLSVEDRHGSRLVYSGGSFIPTSITAQPSGLSLTITQNNGRITSITDPNGNTVQYHYDGSFEGMDDDDEGATIRSDDENWDASGSYEYGWWPSGKTVLSEVERANGAKTEYRYWFLTEEDDHFYLPDSGGWPYPSGMFYISPVSLNYAEDQHYLFLRSVTDANENRHSFRFTDRNERYASTFYYSGYPDEYGHVPVYRLGVPRQLQSVELPDGNSVTLSRLQAFTTRYKSNAPVPSGYVGVQYVAQLCVPTKVRTRISDAQNTAWIYEYEIEPYGTYSNLRTYFDYWPSPGNRGTKVFFPDRLTISNNHGYSEKFEFASTGKVNSNIPGHTDANPHVVSVTESSDQWGNTTRYEYAGMPGISGFVTATSHSKPTKQYDAYNKFSQYQHHTSANQAYQPDFEIDPESRKTDYTYRTDAGKYGLLSETKILEGATTRKRTTFEYANTTWPAFMTKKIEHDIDGSGTAEPSFVQREIVYVPNARGMVAQETVDPGGLNITTRYDYDANNNRIMEIDPNSNTNWFAYDALSRLVAVTNADLTVRSFAYDPRGNKIAETNENGHVTFWQYDGFNRVTNEVVDLNGNGLADAADLSTKTTYNAMGSVSSVTDPNGTVTTNLYDALQRLTNSIVDPGGLHYSTTYAYSTNSGSLLFEPYGFKPTSIVDARGYETKITYDKLYREVKRETQVNATEYGKATKGYDAVGNLRFSTNWVNATQYQVVEHTYDALNQPVKTIYRSATPLVEVETDYTSTGLLWKQWDELDRLTTTEYDKAQRPWKTTQPAVDGVPPVTITQYDSSGNATNVINPRQIATAYRYDKRNRKTHSILSQVYDAESGSYLNPTNITYYDDLGNVAGILDARQNATTNFYDAANRLTNSILPVVAVYGGTAQPYTKTTYDKNGNPRLVEDANGTVVEMRYDALNRLVKSIDGEFHEIGYGYDAAGNRTAITDPNGNATVFEYNGLNRNTRTTYADGSAEQTGFDWLGNRIYREDAKAQRTDYLYDKRNRLDFVDYNNGHTRDYVYDNAGNLLDVYEALNTSNLTLKTVNYTYDALNRVKTETSAGVTHTYGYDLAGNRTNATYGVSGRKVGWAYDNLNRIQTITDTKGYTKTTSVSGGGASLSNAIENAVSGELLLVENGTYSPVTINKPITVKSVNGPANCILNVGQAFQPARCATLSNNAVLVGFTLTGGRVLDASGGGAFVGNGCLIADCDIVGNTASNINAYGGGLFLQTGATAQNCLIRNNRALNGGGIFCEKGGLVRNCTIENNEAESMGGGGVFMQEGGWIANSIIDGNIATNGFARGGGGLFFYNDGGKVNSSTISYNASTNNGAAWSHHSTYVDPGKLGDVSHSILWNNTPSASGSWDAGNNQTVDPSGVSSAPGANLSVSSFASASSRTTGFKYDLNSNLMLRDLPNGVDEKRSYDALNRMVAQTNQLQSTVFSTVEYQYDAVGNLQQMDDSATGLHTIPSSATWSWTYDNSYRLKSETVTAGAGPARKTEFDWDPAGNRTARRKYESTVLKEAITYKPASRLNQMLGWTCGETNALYTYDANGNRRDKFITVNGTTEATNYEYDEDNRLTTVTVRDTEQPKVYSFGYDYRTRRITRETPTEKTVHVFDGGLSVQEFDTSETVALSPNNLTTESIRGKGMGGGVGGMVYSVRNGQVEASHSNHRGDVVARTDNSGKVSWFARYNAYGTRFDEIGSTYDRQRGNTKDEEEEIGISQQGHRPLDIEHGVWLTLDPLGYADGPNRYQYVHCNPITQFDPLGLETVRAIFERNNVTPLYHAWNVLSLGTLGKNDRLVEQMESGTISVGQWQAGSVGNGAVALGSVAAGGGAASLAKTAVVKGAAAGFAAASVDHLGTEAVAGTAGYDSGQDGGALKAATGTAAGAATGFVADKVTKGLSQSAQNSGAAATEETTTVYRGVRQSHPGYQKATQGTASPRSPLTGHSNPAKHNLGNTKSKFVSGTTDRSVATRFSGSDGVVIEAQVPKSRIVPSPDKFRESEVLIKGTLKGETTRP